MTVTKSVTRTATLPPFSANLDEMDILVAALVEHVGESGVVPSITCSVNSTEFKSRTFSALAAERSLPTTLPTAWILVSSYKTGRSISVRYGDFSRAGVTVSAEGDSEAWCAGAVEIARDFFDRHARATRVLFKLPLVPIALALMVLPLFRIPLDAQAAVLLEPSNLGPLVSGMLLFALGTIGRGTVFPSYILVRSQQRAWRAWVPELTLLATVIAVGISIWGVLRD